MGNEASGEMPTNINEGLVLKRAICQQDRKALTLLYVKYYPHIKYYISSRINSVADAEDLAQDVFVELCKGHGSYNGCENTEKYLLGIAKNIIRRYLRNRANSIKTARTDSISNVAVIINIRQHRASTGQIESQELNKSVEEAIEKLPSKASQALKLRFIDGLSPKEASKKAGCSVNTFYQRVHSGIKAIGKVKKRGLGIESIDMNR